VIRGNVTAPGYFETLGIPLRAGRAFGPQDSFTAPKTGIVNETLPREFFPGTSPRILPAPQGSLEQSLFQKDELAQMIGVVRREDQRFSQ
jgi:hypothetical protein